jgi:uncharacterized protein (DUF2126 family)
VQDHTEKNTILFCVRAPKSVFSTAILQITFTNARFLGESMAIRVALHHKTSYHYDRLVGLSPHVFRLRPAVHCRTPIEGYSLRITPENHFINWQQDPFGNILARVVFPEQTRTMSIEVEVIARLEVINPFDFFVDEYANHYPFTYDAQLLKELAPYLEITEDTPLLRQWIDANVERTPKQGRTIVDFLVALNQAVHRSVAYTIRMEPGVQRPDETLIKQLGSCRDSAWLLVQVARHLGLAARFVSGYLVQLTADVASLDGPSGPQHDFTDLHAWTELYIPGAGWIGLDPTSGLFAGEGHIPLACTPDYVSAAPVTGLTDVCQTEFSFQNSVTRIHEDPRVTKPYTEAQWTAIRALGYKIDEDLRAGDVRMTMGGEPTFVSIDDMESAEWNTAALGKHKRERAGDLLERLRNAFAPHGMLHYGQGKQYPGEPLPRWQLGIFWRTDGIPMWRDHTLEARDNVQYSFSNDDAEKFARTLAKHLSVQDNTVAAYEDLFYFLWEQEKLPTNIDPFVADFTDSLERQRLQELLRNGIETPVGFVLPFAYDDNRQQWRSTRWHFRRNHLFLVPGNSPVGLRLPLDSLPWEDPKKREVLLERDQFAPERPLPDYYETLSQRQRATDTHTTATTTDVETDADNGFVARTALCVEVREGRLHVFYPPLARLEQYAELTAAVEATAKELRIPVRIEGYEPPRDPQLLRLLVTPDPGVIEVNIHPASSWDELLHITHTLYEQARLARLGTEKFMLDGRHTGTGGGNHVTIGAAKPADSPLLRRPDVLRSLVNYWQHHPGLSYLFSSAFIGPTSQAPRVDEGRDEKLYELDIAFAQVPEPDGEPIPFWLVDRIFRHLLTDITGNTHRAEFCIDKLYSPDSSSGRLGILEFRAFDMPPHYQMSMMQMALIRALVAWFWREPYYKPLVRWGTELHDRFMLPHYVHADIREVVADLNRAGYAFDMEWFAPFFEFRFPVYGRVTVQDIELELRMAIEPWHVLGEEMTSAGTARYVDSSLERVQVKLTGLTDTRHILACNGCRIPLRSTGKRGEYVAGVRYRAWQPPSALHPTIGTDTPLVFDVVDTWNNRAVGGCTYYVSHPGGRSYEVMPVNAYEAESRRISRFWNYGHTPAEAAPIQPTSTTNNVVTQFVPEGSGEATVLVTPLPEPENQDYPYTLDLRLLRKTVSTTKHL